MFARSCLRLCRFAFALWLTCGALAPALVAQGQTPDTRELKPDVRRALTSRPRTSQTPDAAATREHAYTPQRGRKDAPTRERAQASAPDGRLRRPPVRPPVSTRKRERSNSTSSTADAVQTTAPHSNVRAGTPLSRVLHTSQLSLINSSGTHEEYVDQTGNFVADERTTFDARGGSYDIAVGRSGARYEVFTATDTRGTATTADDISTGILVLALDTNGDYMRDASSTFDLGRDFGLPSAVSVVAGTSNTGREFVIVSSSGFFDRSDPNDPDNEPSPGIVLLVRDNATGGFDASRSRSLVRVGDNQLFNANALALLPSGDLIVADFDSNELRVIRDRDADGIPDTLAAAPYWDFPFSANAEDAPLDIAANSRGVVFSHSAGNDTRLLAIYDDNGDGFADTDEIRVEGLSIDNNLILHGMTVERDGTVYVIEDALGESDDPRDGGNGGIPRIDAFPDFALNGILRDGVIFAEADDEFTQALSGLSFGVETVFAPVGRLTMTNSASRQGAATLGGLATINGTNLTRGAQGATRAEAEARGISVHIEGLAVPVLSFNDTQVHIYVPVELGTGIGSVVVATGATVTAADDARITNANPGIFTTSQAGTGEAVALLVSGNRYTRGPFPARWNNQPSVIALFGTGWRNSLPVTVNIGGKAATVGYAGQSGGFPGLDQINVSIPEGTTGTVPVIVTTADGSRSRGEVTITVGNQ